MSALKISSQQLQIIQHYAQQSYPEECCGVLLGTVDSLHQDSDQQKTLVEVVPTVNAWNEAIAAELQEAQLIPPSRRPGTAARRDRYWINPQDLFSVQQSGRERGLQIVGFYHSHPDHPAVPSECDRLLAWSSYSYIIVSVVEGKVAATQSWSLNAQNQFEAEKLNFDTERS